jgi:hypothetical protein
LRGVATGDAVSLFTFLFLEEVESRTRGEECCA